MSIDRVEDLWTRFLAEGRLEDSEEQELLRALQTDPALRKRLLQDKQVDGLLDAIHATDQDAFARSFQDRLAVEGNPTKFIEQVEERIRRKHRRTAPPPSTSWTWALVAAGVLGALLVMVMMSGSEPAPVVKRASPSKIRVPDPLPPPPEEKVTAAPTPIPEKPKAPELPKSVIEELKRPELPPPPPPKLEEPPKPEPKPPPKVTEVIVARVDDARDLAAGQGVEGRSSVVYADGTRLDLAAGTSTRDYFDAAKGKTLTLEKGTLTADVVRQPQGRPMVVKTPHAEARVVGTAFRLTVDAASTRLDVLSGKVRLTRVADGRFTDVSAGQYAVAGAGLELSAKSSAPKPKPVLLQETFQDPAGVNARWKTLGGVKTAGRLDIDLSPPPPGPNGWGGAGLATRQTFAAPMAIALDVDLPVLHASVVAAVVFIPQGQKRGAEGVFRIQLRDTRYSLTVESGEARDLAGADRAAGGSCKERWRIELDGSTVRFLADDREIFNHKQDLPAAPEYSIQIDGSARTDAPSGARAGFDNVVVEPLK